MFSWKLGAQPYLWWVNSGSHFIYLSQTLWMRLWCFPWKAALLSLREGMGEGGVREFRYMTRMPAGHLLSEVFWAYPTRGRPWGRPRTWLWNAWRRKLGKRRSGLLWIDCCPLTLDKCQKVDGWICSLFCLHLVWVSWTPLYKYSTGKWMQYRSACDLDLEDMLILFTALRFNSLKMGTRFCLQENRVFTVWQCKQMCLYNISDTGTHKFSVLSLCKVQL